MIGSCVYFGQVNNHPMTFRNCDKNPNSYIALFVNRRNPTTYSRKNYWPFCTKVFNAVKNYGRKMPGKYFMFLETHWGGCGCYAQTDGTSNHRRSLSQITAAAIGFRVR